MELNLFSKSSNLYESFLLLLIFPQILISKLYNFIMRRFTNNTRDISLLILTFLYIFYLLIVLNFHFLLCLFLYGTLNTKSNILLWLITNLLLHLIYKHLNKKRENFLKQFLINIFLLLIYLSTCFYYFLSLGDKRQIETADIRRRKRNFYSLFTFAVYSTTQFIGIAIFLISIAIHLINPISLIRIYFELRSYSNKEMVKKLPRSIFKIFTLDLILLILFLFNQLFIVSAVHSFISLYGEYKSCPFKDYNFFQKEFKDCFILIKFKRNFLFSINFFLCIVNCLFLWRYKKINFIFWRLWSDDEESIKNSLELIMNLIDGLLDITCPMFVLFNHLIVYNRRTIVALTSWNYFNDEIFVGKNNSFLFYKFHLEFFTQKCLDYLLTIFSILRIFTFSFVPSLYFKVVKEKKKFDVELFFPLLIDDKIIQEIKIKQLDKSYSHFDFFTEDYFSSYKERRKKFIKLIISSLIENLFTMISLSSFINPFSTLRIIRNMYCYYYYSFYKKTYHNAPKISFSQINKNFLSSQLYQLKCASFDLFIFFPISILICLLSPWNFYYLIAHIIKNSFLIPLNNLKEYHVKKLKIPKNKIISSLNKTFLSITFTKLKTDWITILKTILIHLTIYRGILLWNDLFFLIRYKRDRAKMIEQIQYPKFSLSSKQKKRNKIKSHRVEKLEENEFDVAISDKEIDKRLSSKTLNFLQESNFTLFKFNLNKHFDHIQTEIIFYIPLSVILLFTPWNRKHYHTFFKENNFWVKYQIFWNNCIVFFSDIITIFSTIFLLLSLVKSIDTIILLYYSIRKYIFKNKEFERYYHVYYKSDYKGQISEMMRSLISYFIIIGLVLLNVVLITRIPNLITRIKFYFNTKIMDDLFKFKHLIKIHKNKKLDKNVFLFDDKEICKIAEFLPPKSIINLSLSNSFYLGILNINTVWKNCYENYFKKKLKETNNYEVMDCINISVFSNFKSLCKEVSHYLRNSKKLDENTRDRFIGILQILMEETIESFLNIPHLILIPLKAFSLFTLKIRSYLIIKISAIYEGAFFRRKLKHVYFIFPHNLITKFLDFTIIDSEFYNLQIIGVLCVLDIIMIFFEVFINSFIFFKISFLNYICSTEITNENRNSSKLYKTKIYSITVQLCISLILLASHIFIILLPIIYNNPEIIFCDVPACADHYKEVFIPYETNPLKTFENLWTFFNLLTLMDKLQFIIGNKCINLFLFYFHYLYIKRIATIQNNSDNIIYNIIFFCFNPSGLSRFIYDNMKYLILFVLFPQITIKKIMRKRNVDRSTPYTYSFSEKLLLLIAYSFPFLANFFIRLSITRILLINIYAIVNLIILIYS